MIKINEEIAAQIKGIEYTPDVFCNPIQDINGYWFISKIEADALRIAGEEIEYIAPIIEEI